MMSGTLVPASRAGQRTIATGLAGQQLDEIDRESLRDPHHHQKTWVAPAALDAAEVGEVDLRTERDLLLSEPTAQPQALNVASDDPAPIQHSWIGVNRDYSHQGI